MTVPVHQYSDEERRKRIFAIAGASFGNLAERSDFYVYVLCMIYFTPAFFPSDNPTVQLLNTAGVFAAGFFMHPIGGWVFGRIANKHGYRTAMLISVVMMYTDSPAIVCMPTYAGTGTLAPALLLLTWMFQGPSVGGEYGTGATYMSEVALKGQRGFFASFQYVTLTGGQPLAVLVVVILQQLLSEDELRARNWQISLVIGAITVVTTLWLQYSLSETASKSTLKRKESGTFAELFKYRRAFFTVLSLTVGGSLIFYTFTICMQKHLVNTAGISTKAASAVITFALFAYTLIQLLFDMLSDHIGRKTPMLRSGVLGTFCTLPILLVLETVSSPYMVFFLIILALAIVSLCTSISGLVKAEMFPSEVCALGVGAPYTVGNTIFGGSAEYVALGLKSVGMENVFYWCASTVCLLMPLVYASLSDLYKISYLDDKP